MDKEIVLITGACGRIGSSLREKLSSRYEIIGMDRTHCENSIVVDLSSDESVKKAFSQIKYRRIASVVHLAAFYSFSEEHSPLYDQITVKGTERLLKALQDFEVEQFLFSSTMLVHQPTVPGKPIREEDAVLPSWDYPKSKAATEKLIRRIRRQIPSVILRIAGVYDDHCNSIPISHEIQRIYEKSVKAHFFSGDITHGSSFIHMNDLTDAIELCIEKRKALPEDLTLLLGEPQTLSYDELQKEISMLIFGKEIKTFSIPKPLAKLGAWMESCVSDSFIKPWMIDLADDHYEIDISQARQTLGWNPKHCLAKTLPRMISELKSDPAAWYKANHLQK